MDAAPPSEPRRGSRTAAVGAVVVALLVGVVGVVGVVGAGSDRADPPVGAATVVRVGSTEVDLGPRPAGATAIRLTLACRTAAMFVLADGTHLPCRPGDAVAAVGRSDGAGYTLPLPASVRSTVVVTGPAVHWTVTTAWAVPSTWAVDAAGETYGVVADDGSLPDLVAVVATNGTAGYARAEDLGLAVPRFGSRRPDPTSSGAGESTIPVFTLDGTTVVGEFRAG